MILYDLPCSKFTCFLFFFPLPVENGNSDECWKPFPFSFHGGEGVEMEREADLHFVANLAQGDKGVVTTERAQPRDC